MDLNTMTIPDSAAVGYVHGKALIPQRMVLDVGTLTLRAADNPPETGIFVFPHANRSEDFAGQSVNIKPDSTDGPWVNLRWKNAQDQPVTQTVKMGCALRIEFGPLAGNWLLWKICLCMPDEMKSYILGAFNAEIRKPKPSR
jgi:hypothetical protein